jgi:hypothetical protein
LFVAAPAGELPAGPRPTKAQLDYAHRALQVLFMGLAVLGLFVILGASGPRALVRGAAKKHAVA